MRRLQIYIGVGVGALSIALWGTVPARAEAPVEKSAKPRCKLGMVPVPGAKQVKASLGGTHDVQGFCIDRTEVTTAAYAACVANGKCTKADRHDEFCNAGVAGRGNHPINCVNWHQATAYCAARGLRLPDSLEWEYAAMGSNMPFLARDHDKSYFPWGAGDPSNQLCWNGEGNDRGKGNRRSTCAVGSYPKGRSMFGIYDMSGNVWEWVGYSEDLLEPPKNHGFLRGGSWADGLSYKVQGSGVDGEFAHKEDVHNGLIGFRCAGDPLP